MAQQTANLVKSLYSCEFEVFGTVQGVFFRKFTQKQALSLELRGWCMNTAAETVKGGLEGPRSNLSAMLEWLKLTGSPSSKIEKLVATELKAIPEYTLTGFKILQ